MRRAGTVHVVGAGLAGLSAAVRLAAAGVPVALCESAGQAGGRCRSYHDARLGCEIDNGNHLVLSGNRSALGYLRLVGAEDALVAQPAARFPFVDLGSGARWSVAMNDGPVPFWLARASTRVPGTRPADYAALLRLARASVHATVADVLRPGGPLWRGFVEPMCVAVMNAPPARASARLLWAALAETFLRGGRFARPMLAPRGLGSAFVEPALAFLRGRGAELRFNTGLRGLETAGGQVTALAFADARVALGPADRVILALPPARLAPLLPGLRLPGEGGAILNAHFRLAPGVAAGLAPILGVLSANVQWVFTRGDIVSITISAAEESPLMAAPEHDALPTLWDEARRALGLPATCAPEAARIVKEKRATADQSPEGAAARPAARTPLANLFLAGDAIDTGLPATIEAAIRSGETAARLAAAPVRELEATHD
ncbi:MAG: hypothetical protein CVT80_09600 [Alphaproteobacteria bacterium HGW-Alphaproteobacteria-2]|nr:MAG: hypothetical protein CVT80_09600 [Alphaproteobacteria bacterium HGW-Alphaproteobacteria-2]